MNFLLASPTLDDLIRLLRAWRFWVLGAIVGALIGTAVYFIAPPPYRARATVNVDFNLEQAWPEETDRQQFYYLEREARKLEEMAWSDEVLQKVSDAASISIQELRDDTLQLSQPAEAGWRFHADHQNPQLAEAMASAWANAFVDKVQAEIDAGNINEFVRLDATQTSELPQERSLPLSDYLLAGSFGFLFLAGFIILFTKPRRNG